MSTNGMSVDELAVLFWLRLNARERGVMAELRPSASFQRLATRSRGGQKLPAALEAQKARIIAEALTSPQ